MFQKRRLAGFLITILCLGLLIPVSSQAAPIKMINIWATWCGPCVDEMPYLGEIARNYAGVVDLIGVQLDSDVEEGKELFERSNAGYTNTLYPSSPYAYLAEGVGVIPSTFMLGGKGQVVGFVRGGRDYDGWVWEIDKVLSAMDKPFIAGDADDNQHITQDDLERLIDFIVETIKPASPANADANQQGGINLQDALWLIEKLIAG